MDIVILAAGLGVRLGRPIPKCLTVLADGRTILRTQLDAAREVVGPDARIIAVVGFKMELVMEAEPDLLFAYNEAYDRTNTAKSLLKALVRTGDGGVVFCNGDVVFEPSVLARLLSAAEAGSSLSCVNTEAVAEEEIKYRLGSDGAIAALSKQVRDAAGESIGINFVAADDKQAVVRRLAEVAETDYFEAALELAIEQDGLRVWPVDTSDLFAVEVDFPEDLRRVNDWLGRGSDG